MTWKFKLMKKSIGLKLLRNTGRLITTIFSKLNFMILWRNKGLEMIVMHRPKSMEKIFAKNCLWLY